MTLFQDLRYGVRTLGKSPGFTAVAMLTLALGIGANTAIFTVANGLLLRPLPYTEPDRLVLLSMASHGQRAQAQVMSYLRFRSMVEHPAKSFSGIAAFVNESFNFSGRGDPEQLKAARVSWNFFDVLGVRPAMGRVFAGNEDVSGGKQVVLISHACWLRLFGGASDVLGQNITLDSRDYSVIGVLPAGFQFAPAGEDVDIWAPRVFELNIATPQQVYGGAGFLTVLARLQGGVRVDQAQAEMDVVNKQYQHDNPGRPDADPRQTVAVEKLQDQIVANIRPALLILMGAVGLVLLIACANVASLLLSRALGRKKEIAVRAALGAGRGVILRQLVTESLLLSAASGVIGILLSIWGTHALATFTQSTVPGMAGVHVDTWVLAFTAIVSLLSGILFGLAPALQLSKADLNSVLRDEGRGSTGSRRRNSARNLLVVAQVALSMVLLVAAGLLIRSFIRLQTASPGFDARNVLTMRIALPPTKYSTKPQMIAFYNRMLNEVRTLPGVQTVAMSSALPVNVTRLSPMLPEGQPVVPMAQRPILNVQTISPDYAAVLRVPLIRGRMFTEHDDENGPPVCIVNQTAVRRFWPNENPIGKHMYLGQVMKPVEIVGVFGDVKNWNLANDPNPEIFLPFPQLPWAWLYLDVRTPGDPHALITAVRHQIAMIDKDQPVTNVKSMEEVLQSASAQPRFTMFLLGIFSATAFILAVVGIYGVIAYSVAQRTQELGVRMALGAATADILRLVLNQGLRLTLTGIGIGLAVSIAVTRVMGSLLYKTSAHDPVAFVVSAVLFTVVAVVASYLPARRAVRIDPTDALRAE